jgi:hypothetical protein
MQPFVTLIKLGDVPLSKSPTTIVEELVKARGGSISCAFATLGRYDIVVAAEFDDAGGSSARLAARAHQLRLDDGDADRLPTQQVHEHLPGSQQADDSSVAQKKEPGPAVGPGRYVQREKCTPVT